ncbi:recombination-associated protein RdgC [Dokdonella sp.]|uniref:recombination-associated protein RdgC n=1 Tax=Dokdonella sp. TaxID=2291710 RepID=UPI0031BE5E5F|nr:recombination-associated protein RdgC [Dokdonella sp.]
MFFRNLTLFRFPESTSQSLENLEDDLDQHRLRACGPLELATRGFVSPYGRGDAEALVHRQDAAALVAVGSEERLLPSVVVNEALAERIAEIHAREGRRPGGKERKRLKEEVFSELLPRAFVRPSRRSAYLDGKAGWFVVDTASRKAAEEAVSAVRDALGRFPATPMTPEESPRTLMTGWLTEAALPEGLALGEECELRDPAEAGAIVRCRRQDLESDEMREHLKAGKQVFQLGLVFADRMSFVLGEDLVLRKLKFHDVVLDQLDEGTAESARAEIDAGFALMRLELDNLFGHLDRWFGLPRPGERD